MPLNKLDNFIKNTEGRILYVSPADLDASDSIDNTGNSLARPFKTIQRALLESARFSYVVGNSNDLIERTTILLMPGDHIVDNRPGFKIKTNLVNSAVADAIDPAGTNLNSDVFNLDLNSNFDLTQEDNILYKFNSVYGGVIVPRGTSIVGLDLRKTKIKPKYVPNPTDSEVDNSAIFRITGACYFWQFSFFDGDEKEKVYTDPKNFDVTNQSTPLFSHHKLTCFEYADGFNNVIGLDGGSEVEFNQTDLDMYYAKLSNAYGTASGSPHRDILEKYPSEPDGFSKQRPEWEIVGAFATDPLTISDITADPDNLFQVTVETENPHNLTAGTPIKINGVIPTEYNISTKVNTVDPNNNRKFTYLFPSNPRSNLETGNAVTHDDSNVIIETDTVSGASPYIFNISLRSVYGMNGMHADGSKSSGFRSMVVAQFTGVSLQKDDRAFAKYDPVSGDYNSIQISTVRSGELASGSSEKNTDKQYHLDSHAVYRKGWEQTHIRVSNDAILQIVSVFAIGYNKHFAIESGGDASITNSNSNFGQLSLISDGFKSKAFDKDNKGYITNIYIPRASTTPEDLIDWLTIDLHTTKNATNNTNKLYLFGFENRDIIPPTLTQGYRIGARSGDRIYLQFEGETAEKSAEILMADDTSASTTYTVSNVQNSELTFTGSHNLQTGEKVIIISDNAKYPENIEPHVVYYTIRTGATTIKLASSKTNADNGTEITFYRGEQLSIITRNSDKNAGDVGHPVQYDETEGQWYIKTNSTSNDIITKIGELTTTVGDRSEPTYIKRLPDTRNLDEKVYKYRLVIPQSVKNAKNPESGFILQESSSNNEVSTINLGKLYRDLAGLPEETITLSDYEFNRNPGYIADCAHDSGTNTSTIRTELPHTLCVGETVIIEEVADSANTTGEDKKGYNGTFTVASVSDNRMEFTFVNTNLSKKGGTFNPRSVDSRTLDLPKYKRNDIKNNVYIFRSETVKEYIEDQQDGIFHLYGLKADIPIDEEFTDLKYSQNVTDFYPQLDRDNNDDSPNPASSYAVRSPLGKVNTNDLKKSVTRESANNVYNKLGKNLTVTGGGSFSGNNSQITITFDKSHGLNGIRGIVNASDITNSGETDHTPSAGTVFNVKLYNDDLLTNWRGATARVLLVGGAISKLEIQSPGSGYTSGTLYIDNTADGIGGGTIASFSISDVDLINSVGDTLQFTGKTNLTDSYHKIASVTNNTQIVIEGNGNSDRDIESGEIALHIGPEVTVSSASVTTHQNGEELLSTIETDNGHGLVTGNRIRLIDTDSRNRGDFLVDTVDDATHFKVKTTSDLNALSIGNILKHGYSSGNAEISKDNENIASRGFAIYGNDYLYVKSGNAIGLPNQNNPTEIIRVQHSVNGASISQRFPLGSYIQIDNEIMRVASSDLDGTDGLKVIRGALASRAEGHVEGSLIKKISPIPVEFRRPSIIRASGHTFEYLGYGPGNYSTGLPQVQDRNLTEREEFLSQAQERSAGIVVYTGMNNKGDFYIGNTKKSSATGEETTFDSPIPTVTGEDPSRLSVVFDEATIKERIVVEGGDSNLILSQFDGPVSFNNNIRVKGTSTLTGELKVRNNTTIEGTLSIGSVDHLQIKNNSDAGEYTVGSAATDRALRIQTNGAFVVEGTDGQNLIRATNPKWTRTPSAESNPGGKGSVELYYIDDPIESGDANNNDGLRLYTTTGGVYINGELQVSDDITAFYTSDERLKDNVTAIDDPLAKVLSLGGYTFDWNENTTKEGTETGVIAQEVEALGLPGLVTTRDNGYLAVNYEKLVPLLIEAVKELSGKVEALEEKLSDK